MLASSPVAGCGLSFTLHAEIVKLKVFLFQKRWDVKKTGILPTVTE
jgi:hypothetical protein